MQGTAGICRFYAGRHCGATERQKIDRCSNLFLGLAHSPVHEYGSTNRRALPRDMQASLQACVSMNRATNCCANMRPNLIRQLYDESALMMMVMLLCLDDTPIAESLV